MSIIVKNRSMWGRGLSRILPFQLLGFLRFLWFHQSTLVGTLLPCEGPITFASEVKKANKRD